MAKAPSDYREAEALWDSAISEIQASASAHPQDFRFAKIERWPGYYLVRQRAIASAVRRTPQTSTTHKPRPTAYSHIGSERLLTARAGRLAGRPDHFDLHAVTEYKSSLPDSAWPESGSIIDGYWRQLWLYAVIIGENGSWPASARIVSASGEVLEEPLKREVCEAEADAAISGLDSMNRVLQAGCHGAALASPGQIACGQCPYQAICPAFWSWCDTESWPDLREPAARGKLESIDLGMDGDLYVIILSLDGRRGADGAQSIALRKSVHGDLTACMKGSPIRIVFASTWPNGRLRADISTCLFDEDNLPELRCGSA